jgi:signal transduction histidine kinase/ActR/RegA family two-component response regulator
VLGAVAVLVDLTEWRQAEERAAQYRRELDLIIQNVPARMYQLREDASGARHFTIVAGDPDELFGPGSRAVLDDRLQAFDIVYPPDQPAVRAALASARAQQLPLRVEFRTAHDPSRWIRSEARPRHDEATGSLVWHGYWIDVTDKYEQEAALIQARKQAEDAVQAKGRFLALMNHEIRTPLQGMLGMIDVLREAATDAEAVHMLTIIDQSALTLGQILDDVLDFAKLDEGQLHLHPEDADLRAVVEQTVIGHLSLARAKSLTVEVQFDGCELTTYRFDKVRVRQILSNLLSNAIKFTANGTIIVRLQGETPDQGRQALTLSVSDTGIGIPADELDGVFQAFHQAVPLGHGATSGTGLGLAICRQLARLLGGELSVSSEVAHGSVFSLNLTLPIVSQPRAAPLADVAIHLPWRPVTGHVDAAALMLAQAGAHLVHQLPVPEPGARRGLCLCDQQDLAQPGVGEAPWVVLSHELMGGTYKRMDHGVMVSCAPLLLSALLGAINATRDTPAGMPRPAITVSSTDTPVILLVEDNEIARLVIERQIQQAGWQCRAVASGYDALDALKATPVAMVLTDIQMPGLDGYAWVRQWRAWEHGQAPGRRLPIIALTALMSDTDQAWTEAGMDGYVTKPIRVDDLRTLSHYLSPSPQPPCTRRPGRTRARPTRWPNWNRASPSWAARPLPSR